MGSAQKYGIERELIERVKRKLKDPEVQERVGAIMDGVTKADLQDPAKVAKLLARASKTAGIALTTHQTEAVVTFIVKQKIDPSNTFHLIKLWAMFR